VNELLGRGRVPASSTIDVEEFQQFFVDKVAKVEQSTEDAAPPAFSRAQPGCRLSAAFRSASARRRR